MLNLNIYTDASTSRDDLFLGVGIFCEFSGREWKASLVVTQEDFLTKRETKKGKKVSNPTIEFFALHQALCYFSGLPLKMKFYCDYIGCRNWLLPVQDDDHWAARNLIIRRIKKSIKDEIKEIEKNGGEVEVIHIPGHSGIYGNEMADSLAKERKVYSMFPSLVRKIKKVLTIKEKIDA